MKKLLFVSLILVAGSNAYAGNKKNCDPAKFLKNIEVECKATKKFKKFVNAANYCKQYPGTDFAVATSASNGDVVMLDKSSCIANRFDRVDSKGIAELKVVGGFVYMRSNDGQLYILDAKGFLYEIQSLSGKSYRGDSAVTDIAGQKNNSKVAVITLANGQTFNLNPTEVTHNENRWELLEAARY